jgi:hypothetical protein
VTQCTVTPIEVLGELKCSGFDVSTSYNSFYGCHSEKVERDVRSTLTSSVAMATGYVHSKMAAATCYTYTGAIRKKLREMSGVQLRHQSL